MAAANARRTPEERARISETIAASKRGKPRPPEVIAKMRRKRSPEVIARVRAARWGIDSFLMGNGEADA